MSQDKTDYRAKFKKTPPAFPTVAVSLEVPKLLDPETGEVYKFEGLFRRIDLASLIYNKSLPQSIAVMLLGDKRYTDAQVAVEEAKQEAAGLSPKETIDVLEFMWTMAKKVCVSPRLIDGSQDDEGEGELALRDYEGNAAIIEAIYQYGMNMTPALPVKLTDGQETSVRQVERFYPLPSLSGSVRNVA